jgi:gliding motility-associated-like protein
LSIIADIAQEEFELINIPFGVLYFYVETTYDCFGDVVVQSDTIDNRPPELVHISYLDVSDAGITVHWNDELNDPLNHGYVIYRTDGNGTNALDTVYGVEAYLDDSVLPIMQPEIYYVLALDPCGNLSIFDTTHTSLYLDLEFDYCTNKFQADWNLIEDYQLLDSVVMQTIHETGDIFRKVLKDDATSSLQSPLSGNGTYCIEILLYYSSGDVATSNEVCETIQVAPSLKYLTTSNVSMLESSVLIEWLAADLSAIESVEVIGQDIDGDNIWSSGIQVLSLGDNQFVQNFERNYTDDTYQTYRINIIDDCGVEYLSEPLSNLRLSLLEIEGELHFSWDDGELSDLNPLGYHLYKVTPDGPVLLGSFNNQVNSFIYELTPEDLKQENVGFYCLRQGVVSSEFIGESNILSYSNQVYYEPKITLVFPNAIAPNGYNTTFKPVWVSGVYTAYELQIFDRYGQQLYITEDLSSGWLGQYQDRPLPAGKFHYVASIIDRHGEVYIYEGDVVIVR